MIYHIAQTFLMRCLLLLVKNEVTYRIRVRFIWGDFEAYKKLPTYHAMLWHPYRWTYASWERILK